jgi:hypothetical protein
VAATAQAGIGNVVAGSFFAMLQSISMGGAVPAAITAIGAGVTGVIAAAASRFGPRIISMGTAASSAVGWVIHAVTSLTRS